MTSYAPTKDATAAAAALDAPEAQEFLEKRTLPLSGNVCSSLDYECDSLSDGREKADTTPENLKKNDDVIETSDATVENVETLRSHFWSHPSVVIGSTTAKPVLRVDESIRKLDMDNKSLLRNTKDTLCKRDRIESASNVSPLTADESSIDSTSTAATKQSFAFTIDNFNDKECDPAAAQAKYKSMMERFQQRHRRGASMSKLENSSVKETFTTSSSAASLTKVMTKSLNTENCDNLANVTEEGEAATTPMVSKVKLRVRDRSTSRVRDASKRHSWSPRSSTSESTHITPPANKTSTNNTQLRSRQDAMPPQGIRKAAIATKTKPPALQMPKSTLNTTPPRQQFTPRSTAMQLALQKVDFLCAQPPLADFKHLQSGEVDNISEAGTYTLDGDNYTEEQKDLMNIDKSTLERAQKARRAAQAALNRPTDLELSKIPITSANSRQNVLEVNYYHEQEPVPIPRASKASDYMLGNNQSASSYLEKIKSRVLRNMSVTKNSAPELDMSKMIESTTSVGAVEKSSPNADVGTFTSVTTSGVLAKQCALDARPKLTRRSSLSTSQIDSSEYVSNESKLKQSNAVAYSGGGFTDHQKAEYRLNVFTNQKDTQTFSGPSRSFLQTPPDSPSAYKAEQVNLSDAAVLKTAQNKNDWIQEWARNARARSLASCDSTKSRQHLQTQELMTRSYTCSETGGESLTDDSVFNAQRPPAGYNKTLATRYRLVGGEFDYASDPALSSSCALKTNSNNDDPQRPPKSPSKIPSPLHSLGRARSASRTRASLQNMLQMEAAEADSYLQKTAAAINSLQQSLSRKNSLQSPHSGSPRAAHTKKVVHGAYYSPEENSPQHSLESPTGGYQHAVLRNAHKRNLSMDAYSRDTHAQAQLMTSSFNEQQLKILTGGCDNRPRGRKNSFDGNMQLMLPNSPAARRDNWGSQTARESNRTRLLEQQQHQAQHEANSMSPLRRSSSYSAKIATARPARPQFQNLYTPPAARHNYLAPGIHQPVVLHAIKKSASSNNFGNVYSDYDENLAYYIKDEDDYADDDIEEYYSSGDELPDHDDYMYSNNCNLTESTESRPGASEGPNVPLSNTRYNKALLMRIERSKQKVAAGGKVAPSSATTAKTILGAAGVAACPNTPELPRRNIKSAPRSNAARQSMPRDSSLNRLAGQIPNSLASAKKQLLQTAAAVPSKPAAATRVQPKYLDISKYKPAQGNNFLRKNDAKSTLKPGVTESMKRSPSSSSMGLSRGDATRASNRSAKSVTAVMTTSGTTLSGRASSAVRRDASVAKQKEAEMAMWKRRSKYDPMKAAAEDRRKKEEAKKLAQTKNEFVNESANQPNTFLRQTSCDNQWTMGLHEAGDEELSD